MSFSYTDDLVADKDYVRFQLGDTVEAVAMFSDELILATLEEHGDNAFRAIGELLDFIPTSPGVLLALHDAAGRTFTMSRLAAVFGQFAEQWSGRR